MAAGGRPRHSEWLNMNFQYKIDPQTKRAAAYCMICQKTVKNTAVKRLEAHRNICKVRPNANTSPARSERSTRSDSDVLPVDKSQCSNQLPAKRARYNLITSEDEDEDDLLLLPTATQLGNDAMDKSVTSVTLSPKGGSATSALIYDYNDDTNAKSKNDSEISRPSTSFSNISIVSEADSDVSYSCLTHSPTSQSKTVSDREEESGRASSQSRSKIVSNIFAFADKMTVKENAIHNNNLAKFIFGCNIPLSVVESTHFKAFVKGIRPSYKLPTRKTLSSTLLDTTYEDCLKTVKFGPQSVLLMDGWKNESSNSKNVAAMLHNASGAVGFLDAWDISGESETGEKLSELVALAITRAQEMHNTKLYAVVSDNAANMVKMGKLVDLWHVTCNSHSGNLLAKSLVPETLANRVNMVLKGFSGPDVESKLLFHKGHRVILGGDTRWRSYRDAFQCCLSNLPAMKLVLADPLLGHKISKNVTNMVFDTNFARQVEDRVHLFNPVCKLINVCQSQGASLADATEEWLSLELPPGYPDLQKLLDLRRVKALNTFGLVANYLHPQYRGAKLSPEQLDDVDEFFLAELDVDGFNDLHAFKNNQGIFGALKTKQEQSSSNSSTISASVFWGLAARKHPSLFALADKLNNIPASSAQLERIFSNWSYVHNSLRNRLTFDRSKKLLHVYHTLKVTDVPSDEY